MNGTYAGFLGRRYGSPCPVIVLSGKVSGPFRIEGVSNKCGIRSRLGGVRQGSGVEEDRSVGYRFVNRRVDLENEGISGIVSEIRNGERISVSRYRSDCSGRNHGYVSGKGHARRNRRFDGRIHRIRRSGVRYRIPVSNGFSLDVRGGKRNGERGVRVIVNAEEVPERYVAPAS